MATEQLLLPRRPVEGIFRRLIRAEMRPCLVASNARFPADSGSSLRDPCRSAIRPTETSAVGVCYVRNTSIPLKNPVLTRARFA
jgi:hypothetical protein